MKEVRYIVDTTMRDGEQSAGVVMTKEQKILIARLLDGAGISQIEAGAPAVSNEEIDTLCEIMQNRQSASVSVWNRLNITDIQKSFICHPDIIHIATPVSYAQIYAKLNKNKRWILRNLSMCVDLALSEGFEVTVGFEDASRADITFMISLASTLKDMGVSRIRFSDTVGIMSPTRTFQMIGDIIKITGIEVEFHAHNDLGMAVTNTLIAAKAGAQWLDTTICGIGERAGNCNFYQFIHMADDLYDCGITKSHALTLEEKIAGILNRHMP